MKTLNFSFRLLVVLFICVSFASQLSSQITPSPTEREIIKNQFGLDDSQINKAVEAVQGNESKENVTPTETKDETEIQESKTDNSIKGSSASSLDSIIDSRKADVSNTNVIWGHQFFRDKSIGVFDRSFDARAMDSYIISAGDELSIAIWGNSVYSSKSTVNSDGYIDFSSGIVQIPRMYVDGLKYVQAREFIRKTVARYINLNGSQFEISLNYTRTITVNIAGEVFTPGGFTISATNTAFNALVAAGGPNDIGSIRKIKVFSASKPERTLDVYKFIENPSISEEFFLFTNDYIFVPLAEKVVNISGAVKRPSKYELIEGEDLLQLISYAGGLKANAYKSNIIIERYKDGGNIIVNVNLEELLKSKGEFLLNDGDRIHISTVKPGYENYVRVNGAVKQEGDYEWVEGVRISDILVKAKLEDAARTDRAYIFRNVNDISRKRIRINIDSILAFPKSKSDLLLEKTDIVVVSNQKKFELKKSVRIFGAVQSPSQYPFYDNITIKDLVFFAGGLKKEAANNRIEVSRIVENDQERTEVIVATVSVDDSLNIENGDFVLAPNDQIFVRTVADFKLQQNVVIRGQVKYPGIYTLLSDKEKLSSIIKRAGGTKSYAFLDGATLYRQDSDVGYVLMNLSEVLKKGKSKRNSEVDYNYVLRPGDIITIPKQVELVTIKGAVNYNEIGILYQAEQKLNVPFHKEKNARFYVDEYGAGVDRKGKGRYRFIEVLYPNGQIKKTKAGLFGLRYPSVVEGSTIFVGKKKEKTKKAKTARSERESKIEWQKVLADTLAATTSVVTLLLLINRL